MTVHPSTIARASAIPSDPGESFLGNQLLQGFGGQLVHSLAF